MASAYCINNPHLSLSPENNFFHLPTTYSSLPPAASPPPPTAAMPDQTAAIPDPPQVPDLDGSNIPDVLPDVSDIGDFEFRIGEPVNVLPADQLFSDGKLFPLHLNLNANVNVNMNMNVNCPVVVHQEASSNSFTVTATDDTITSENVQTTPEINRIINGVAVVDSFLYSPKAPKCSSKWKELLGLRKLYVNSSKAKQGDNGNGNVNGVTTTSSSSSSSGNSSGNGNAGSTKSFKYFLYRSSKSSTDSSINLPLLNVNDTDNEPSSVPSRHSLSSSSSGHDPDDLPRLSLDSEKPLKFYLNANPNPNNPPRMKLVKTRTLSTDGSIRGVSTESPRMNSSGKIVFHSLERSSSSPGSFNGGPRLKHRGMERSYSGTVRITPVLNVPVCSLKGFPLFSSSSSSSTSSSSQKHESSNNSNRGTSRNQNRNQQMNHNSSSNNNKSKTDRS